MSQSQITIVVNGEYSQRVAPERCDVSFRVAFDSTDADEALTKVTETTNRISAQLRELAPPKASPTATTSFSGERRPVALEAEAPMVEGHPVTKWSVQRIRKSSNTQRVKDSDTTTEGHAPAGRAFNVTTSTTYREETRYFVSTNMEATFHDFSKLEVFVGGIMVRVDTNVADSRRTLSLRSTISTGTRRRKPTQSLPLQFVPVRSAMP